jgi:hypothetical protein
MTIAEFSGDYSSLLPRRVRRCRSELSRAEPLGFRAGKEGLGPAGIDPSRTASDSLWLTFVR